MNQLTIYPNLVKTFMFITLDNGGINRTRSIDQWNKEVNTFLLKQNNSDLHLLEWDRWLGTKDEKTLDLIAAGGQDEPETIEAHKNMPEGLDEFLNIYFEEVC